MRFSSLFDESATLVVARSPDRATSTDRRSPVSAGDLRSGPVARSGDRATTADGPDSAYLVSGTATGRISRTGSSPRNSRTPSVYGPMRRVPDVLARYHWPLMHANDQYGSWGSKSPT